MHMCVYIDIHIYAHIHTYTHYTHYYISFCDSHARFCDSHARENKASRTLLLPPIRPSASFRLISPALYFQAYAHHAGPLVPGLRSSCRPFASRLMLITPALYLPVVGLRHSACNPKLGYKLLVLKKVPKNDLATRLFWLHVWLCSKEGPERGQTGSHTSCRSHGPGDGRRAGSH
jgi:hypothetical protein